MYNNLTERLRGNYKQRGRMLNLYINHLGLTDSEFCRDSGHFTKCNCC